jgi:class 3 adenylate cyclase
LGARRAGIAKQSDQSAAPDAVPVRTAAAIHSHAEAPSPAAVQRESLGVERRQLTVMFCDLADSTQLDPEDRRVCSTPYQEQVSEAVRASTVSSPSTWATVCWSISAIRMRNDAARFP